MDYNIALLRVVHLVLLWAVIEELPMKRIGEAPNYEEESPLNVPGQKIKIYAYVKKMSKGYFFPKSNKHKNITLFLDKMKIHQVFPSEINVFKLLTSKKSAKMPADKKKR